ncbi:hypothetical protein ABZ858_28595 [Streptomyces sp. NPDC047017]|uniref:hypothetical protein n=1 Tax=Streptomyces sp. NPDC047017 TaxID=3155024 RepID=UPI0033F0AF02
MQEARCPDSGTAPAEESTTGLRVAFVVLVVSLTVAAVGVYELCGFGLHALAQRPHLFSDGFATAGVIVALVAAGAAAGDLAWHLTAARGHAARTHAGDGDTDADTDGGTGADTDGGADGDAGAPLPGPAGTSVGGPTDAPVPGPATSTDSHGESRPDRPAGTPRTSRTSRTTRTTPVPGE